MMDTPFDPSAASIKGNLFGLPYTEEKADVVIIPMPWEVTVSYGAGTTHGPEAVLEASAQVDLELVSVKNPWELKVAMLEVPEDVKEKSDGLRKDAAQIIDFLESEGGELPGHLQKLQQELNDACEAQHLEVYRSVQSLMASGKISCMLGGDHSTPLGLIKAMSEQQDIGILQIDAHMDLRNAFEGFTYSHASIMYNALQLPGVKSLTQVGIRDFCEEELAFIRECEKPVHVYYDEQIRQRQFSGETFESLVREIIASLPQTVYVSFDIDGLEPSLCPNTGTPVPGGLQFNEAIYLLEQLVRSGRRIISFDLSEVSPGDDDWDANVGSRVLFRLCTLMGVSHGLLQFK